MANAIYPKYKEAAIGGGANTDLLTGNIKAVLVDTNDYTYASTHEFLDDIPAGARVATSGNMGTKTVTNGTFDCSDFTWTAVSGDESEAIVWYVDTGVEGTSRLINYMDTNQTNLPVTPNGGDITYQVDDAGVFTI